MKIKNKLFTLFALVLVLFMTACGSSDEEAVKDSDDLDVALLIQHKGDMSFNDGAVLGLEKAEEEYGINGTVIEYGTNPDNYEASIVDAAESGYDMLVTSSSLVDYVIDYAEMYPDIIWIVFDTEFDFDSGDYDNVYTTMYSSNEGGYLGGYLAANLTETDTLGFLGGMDAPIINDFLVGYIQGALAVNPDIKIPVNYVEDWTDSAKGKELSLAMNNNGADVIFQVAGASGVGAFEAGVEKGFQVLGIDSDQAMIFADAGKTEFSEITPTSVLKNVGESLYRAVGLYLEGDLAVGSTETLGITENAVGLAENEYYEELVDKDLRAEIKEIEEKISAGEIEVESVYEKSPEEVRELIDSVK